MAEKKINFDASYFCICSNELIKASQKMSLSEMKLIQICISQILSTDKEFLTYTTTASELAQFLNTNIRNIYRDYDHITDKLMGNIIKLRVDNEIHKFQWVSKCIYNKQTHTISIKLHEDLKPFLLNVQKFYTQIELSTIVKFKSYYTLRLYQLILCENGASKRINFDIGIGELRNFFGIDEERYKLTSDLLKKTVKPSIDEINKGDFFFKIVNYQENHSNQQGNPIESISFTIVITKAHT